MFVCLCVFVVVVVFVIVFVFVFVRVCGGVCVVCVCLFVCVRVRGYMSVPTRVPSMCDLCVPKMDTFVCPPSEQKYNFNLMRRTIEVRAPLPIATAMSQLSHALVCISMATCLRPRWRKDLQLQPSFGDDYSARRGCATTRVYRSGMAHCVTMRREWIHGAVINTWRPTLPERGSEWNAKCGTTQT